LGNARHGLTRREILSLFAKGALAYPLLKANLYGFARPSRNPASQVVADNWQLTSDELLEEIISRAFLFFWDEAGKNTGLIRDRALADGGPERRRLASIAATGYGLAALCIGEERGYLPAYQIRSRVKTTLTFALNHVEQVNGFFYHFIDMNTGRRMIFSEVSPMDTTIFLCGALTAREYFHDSEISDMVTTLYRRVNWRWMMNGGKTLAMGWTPEYKFIGARWDTYCELMMMYLLAIAAPVYNISPSSWNAFRRPVMEYEGLQYISGPDPLFVHQYSHAWFDFRHQRDQYANYFQNSATATYAHKLFCQSIRWRFPDYEPDAWGITASDSRSGYQAWGGPPEIGHLDGTIVPCAPGGSVPFLPKDTIACLVNLYNHYGRQAWKKYGFVDAFNPLTGWTDPDALGIDQGITMVMAENRRSNLIWNAFMKNHESQRAMKLVGFRSSAQSAAAD
jgi:hypothetical protein